MRRLLLLIVSAMLLGATQPRGDDLDVPYVPTPEPMVERMLDMAQLGPADYLIDLGSGDGRIPIAAARRGARALGVEINPRLVADAVLGAQMAGVETKARFRRQDLFRTPLREASVVTMYLLPAVNLALRPRLLTELRPGTRIVSHAFDMGDWRPDAHEQVDGRNAYLWIVPAVVGGNWTLRTANDEVLALTIEQRFQVASGTATSRAGAVELRGVQLLGDRLQFMVGERVFHGIVGDAAIEPDPAAPAGAEAGWVARRSG